MKKLKNGLLALLLMVPLWLSANGDESTYHIIGNRMLDVHGTVHRIGVENKQAYPVALVFIDIGCVISQRMVPHLNETFEQAKTKGVKFYGVISNPKVKPAEALKFQEEFSIAFPLLLDANGDLAHRLQPTVVPESFVFDRYDNKVYYGRINDQYADIGKFNKNIRNADLQNAIAAIAAGQKPATAHEPAKGCIFESWEKADRAITFYQDIEPITRANCASCHKPNDIGPFSLLTYEDVSRRGRMVEYVTKTGYMPIWKAETGYGKFSNEHTLSDYQIDLIKTWVQTGMQAGDADTQIPVQAAAKSEWKLGPPDLILKMDPYDLPAAGDDQYRVFVMKDAIPKGKVIKAIDFKPGDPSVVHHSTIFVDYTGTLRGYDDADPLAGYDAFKQGGTMEFGSAVPVCGWAPGIGPYSYPDQVGFYVEEKADLAFENHYHLTGKATTDQSYVGIYFAKGDTKKFMTGSIIGTQRLQIPANEGKFKKEVWSYVPIDIEIFDLTPHMHYIGTEVKVDIILPGGTEKPLLHVNDWDLRWQSVYTLRELTPVPKGSIIRASFTYDNSEDNHDNPYYPPQEMFWGWGSNDEMCEVYFSFVPKSINDYGKMMVASFASFEHTWPLSARTPVSKANAQEIAQKLVEADIWSDDGQALLMSIIESCMADVVMQELDQLKSAYKSDSRYVVNRGQLELMDAYLSLDEARVSQVGERLAVQLYQLIEKDNTNWNASFLYGKLLLDSGVPTYAKQGAEALESLRQYQSSYDKHPKQARLYWEIGKYHYRNRDDARAEAVLKEGLQLFPNNPDLKQELASGGRIVKKTLN